ADTRPAADTRPLARTRPETANRPEVAAPWEGKMRQETVIQPLALERLKRALGSKADQLLAGIINTFSLDGEQLVQLMHQSLAERDQAELLRAAHTMKSTAATFGADNLSAMA